MKCALLAVLACSACALPVIHTGPGTLVVGDACESSDDCASGLCAPDAKTQRHCAPNECPDGKCGDGLACAQELCGTRCISPLEAGAQCFTAVDGVCDDHEPCAAKSICIDQPTDTGASQGFCIAPGTSVLGGLCHSDVQCQAGLFCDAPFCVGCDDAHPCGAGFSCGNTCDFDGGYSTCAPLAGVGEHCNGNCLEGLTTSCQAGLDCIVDACFAPGAAPFGAKCNQGTDCADGFCNDGNLCGRCQVDADCSAGDTCAVVLENGARGSDCVPAAQAGDVCGSPCTADGICSRNCPPPLGCSLVCGNDDCCG